MLTEKIMATVSAKVYEHHKKTDGTYNVKICYHTIPIYAVVR